MSIRVPKSSLTVPQRNQIFEDLYIAPSNWFAEQNGGEAKSWDFLEDDEDHYRLPFHYIQELGYQSPEQPQTRIQLHSGFMLQEHQKPLCKKASEALDETGSVILHAGTGAGKTAMSIYMAIKLEFFVLVVHPSRILQKQWVDSWRNYSNAKVWEPGSKMPIEEAQVVVCGKLSCKKIPQEFLDKVGVLVVDEVHRFYCQDAVHALLCTQPEFVITCSATPFKKGKDAMLGLLAGENVVRYQSVKHYKILRIDTQIKIPLVTTVGPGGKRRPNWTGIEKEIAENQNRTTLLIKIIQQTVKAGHKMFVITKRSDHRDALVKGLKDLGISVEYLSSNKDKYHECSVLIANFAKAGAGLDEENNCVGFSGVQTRVAMIASSIKDEVAVAQLVGRVRHCKPIIMDLVDQNRILTNHWKARLKVYQDLQHWLEDPNLTVEIVNLTAEEILEESSEEDNDPWADFE